MAKSVSFYTPTDKGIDRKRKMAEMLMQQGQQPQNTEMLSGVAVKQSPLAGIAKALTSGLGGLTEGAADRAEQQKVEGSRKTMADALEAYSRSQAGGETTTPAGETISWDKAPLDRAGAMYQNILMGNPDTAPLAMQQAMENIQYDQRFPKELELARAKAAIEAQYRAPPSSVQEWQFGQNNPDFLKWSQETGSGGSKVWQDAQNLVAASEASGQPMDLMTAYSIAKSGLGVGRTMTDGAVAPTPGALETTKDFKYNENYGGKTGELTAAGQFNLPDTTAAYRASDDKITNLVSAVDRIAPDASALTTGAGGALTSWVPGTPAFDLKKNVDTLLAGASFGELQEMRQNSPTGGALGSVAVRELQLLSAAKVNLETSQSPGQFVENLGIFRKQMVETQKRIKDAYEADVARFGQNAMQNVSPNIGPQGQGSNPAITQPDYSQIQPAITTAATAPPLEQDQEGDTATGPNGERLIFRGGRWVPK